MQADFSLIEAALTGSVRNKWQVDAWYDGQLVAENVNVIAGQVDVDTSRDILATATATAGSDDGTLAPTGYDSPLACYGSELHVRASVETGGDPLWFSLGWFRIDDYTTSEWWRDFGDGNWVSKGLTVENDCSDRWVGLSDANFLAPTQPSQTASVLAEIGVVANGILTLADWAGITDGPIPNSFTFDTSRATTVQGLAALLGCAAYLNPDGALDLRSTTPGTTPVWSVTVGSDGVEAPLLAWSRKGDRANIYNGVVSTGQAADGSPTSGQALESSGPLAWGGPFGQVAYAHSDATLTLNAQCQTDAAAQLALLAKQRTVTIPVTLPWNPALEAGDVLQLTLPDRVLTGPVVACSWPLAQGPMTASVAIPRDDLWGLVSG